ncbi:unnamed protein product [Clonostachys rosea f. rosea IK726]|uniref:Uncharacterized protein n=1 Tax=Clonostachys rosea f. rosea IK726 TaxID=1349383 RepID=A0ACA9U857_BIOOC|nr:unnamed protein product [Clonostachys rosea f. rosea IK726]
MLSTTNNPLVLFQDPNSQANSGPVMNGFRNEFSASPSPGLLRSDSGVAKSKTSKNGTTPTSTASMQPDTKPSSVRKDNRALKSTPTSVQVIEMRSSSSIPKSQSSARPTTYQVSMPGSGYITATNLDSENGVPNGTLGERKQPESPVVTVDDDDDTSSASLVLTLNRDDQAKSASPVNLNEDGYTASASPVVMMDLDESVGSARSVIMVDGDTDTPRPVIMMNGNNEPRPATRAPIVNGDRASPANQNVTVHGVDEARQIMPVPVLTNGFAHLSASRPRLRVNPEKKVFDSDAFDALLYAQPGALLPPKGGRAFRHGMKGSNRSQLEDRLYLHRDPAIQGMHERSEEWYRKKLALRPPGARKKWLGRVGERQRWLKSQQDKISRPSDNGLRERGPKRKDPEPWTHQRSLDFGDIPEDDLPSYVKENPAWLKFCGRLRNARTRTDAVNSSVQRRERVKQQVEVDKRPLTRKEIAQRQLASKFMRQTEEFYNSMKQA